MEESFQKLYILQNLVAPLGVIVFGILVGFLLSVLFKKSPSITYTNEDNLSPEKRAAMEDDSSTKEPSKLLIKSRIIFNVLYTIALGLVAFVSLPIDCLKCLKKNNLFFISFLFPATGYRIFQESQDHSFCEEQSLAKEGILSGTVMLMLSGELIVFNFSFDTITPPFVMWLTMASIIYWSANTLDALYELGRWYRTK